MAPHSHTLAWKIPWAEEPGRLQSMGLLRVGHTWSTSLSCIGEGNGNPLHYSCLENPRDRGAWWAAVYGVAQNWTRLKRLSSSSSSSSSSRFLDIFFLCVCIGKNLTSKSMNWTSPYLLWVSWVPDSRSAAHLTEIRISLFGCNFLISLLRFVSYYPMLYLTTQNCLNA